MPIIDVSQSSYRALVIAAHRRGESIDRFIEHGFAGETGELPGEIAVIRSEQAPRVDVQRTAGRVNHHADDSAFGALWGRIERSAGTQFATKRGQGFTYEIEAGYLVVRESGTRVPKSQFKKALAQWPATGPSTMRGIYAASVVWAVLADRRVMDGAA